MDRFSQMPPLEQWYYHVNVDTVLEVFEQSSKKGRKSAAKMVKKAGRRTHEQTLEKLTRMAIPALGCLDFYPGFLERVVPVI